MFLYKQDFFKMSKHGGARKGSGRKSKAEELKVQKLGINAIVSVYGSVEEYYNHIAKESKESFPHLKLLQEYVFGKPKEVVENHNINKNEHTISSQDKESILKAFKENYG